MSKLKQIVFILVLIFIRLNISAQTKEISINGNIFKFQITELDTLEGGKHKILSLFRDNKNLLKHTIIKKEVDCSSLNIELGKYEILGNKIIFYSYWAGTDRMPNSIIPFGFRKEVYLIDKEGKLEMIESEIYIEDFINNGNEKYYTNNDNWKHLGLNYLNKKWLTNFEKNALKDYKKNIEIKYNSKFVIGKVKKNLEREVRKKLSEEIKIHTENWVNGEIYGKVRK